MAGSVVVAAPANALDGPDVGIDSIEEVEEAVEEVLAEVPVIGDLVEETLADVSDLEINETADVVVELEADNGSTLEIPDEADEPIVLEAPDGSSLEVELPGNGDDAEVTDDGSVIFEDAVTDTDIVVQAQEDGGVRMIAVIDGAGAPETFDFPMDQEIILADDGSAFLVDGADLVAQIPAAWAYDANGDEVPSWYTIEGGSLVLNVDHSTTNAYPVIADPQLKVGWTGTVTLKLDSGETDELLQLLADGRNAWAVAGTACSGITYGLCAKPWVVGAFAISVGTLAIRACRNDRGVDLHMHPILQVSWCSGY